MKVTFQIEASVVERGRYTLSICDETGIWRHLPLTGGSIGKIGRLFDFAVVANMGDVCSIQVELAGDATTSGQQSEDQHADDHP